MAGASPQALTEPFQVLLVEDRPGDAELVRLALGRSRLGRFEVTRATEIDEALRCAKDAPYDVVLLDLSDEGGHGIAAVRAACPGLPLVALSDRGDEAVEQDALRSGAQEFVAKHELPRRNLASVLLRAIERGQHEREHDRLEKRLLAAEQLERLGRISSDITHDLNDLLVTILGNAELVMLDLPDASDLRDCVSEIETAAQRAANLTRQLGTWADRSGFDLEIVHVSRLVSDMGRGLRSTVNWSPTVVYEPGDELQRGAWLYADIRKMRDAIPERARQRGRIPERARGRHHRAHRTRVGESGRICETATTPTTCRRGITSSSRCATTVRASPPETIQRIFDPAYSTKHPERGIGLAATLGVVRAHQGTIRVSSDAEKGTVVRILLPCASAMRPERLPMQSVRPAPKRDRMRKVETPRELPRDVGRQSTLRSEPIRRDTVLIVDPEPESGRVTSALLLRAGYRVCTASSRRRAIALLRRRRASICAVVLDLSLAEIAQSGTFAGIRGIAPDLPVIFCNAHAHAELQDRIAGLDHVAIANKPFEPGEFTRKLREARGDTRPEIQDAG